MARVSAGWQTSHTIKNFFYLLSLKLGLEEDNNIIIILPIVETVNGLIAKSLDKLLKRLTVGSWDMKLMQKAVPLYMAHIVRRFLSLKL